MVFNAKGNPFGQLLMVVFALISWLKHPYNGNRAEVSMEEPRYLSVVVCFMAFFVNGKITTS